MELLLDNIIYSLQRSGGISMIWTAILESVSEQFPKARFIERGDSLTNIFRRRINIPSDKIISYEKDPLIIDRYTPVKPKIGNHFIFHSSYYRFCPSIQAVNVVTIHDFTYEKTLPAWSLSRFVHHKQKKEAVKHAESIVCVSKNTRNDFIHYFPEVPESKVKVIHNGVSLDYYRLPDRSSEDFVLFVGSRVGYKNFELTIDAVSNAGLQLVVCGEALSEREKFLLRNKLGEGRYAECIDTDNNTLNCLYNSAYCLAYPSSYEGFGLPIIEAQKAGCPVIAYGASSIPEVMGESPLIMSHLSSYELSEKLRMLKSDSLRNEVIEQGLSNAQRFSLQKMQEDYLELYKSFKTDF